MDRYRYEFWQHKSGEIYAVRVSNETNRVVEAHCCALHHTQYNEMEPENFRNVMGASEANWFNNHENDFALWEKQ